MDVFSDFDKLRLALDKNLPLCWGVTFGGSTRLEEIHLKLYIDEEKEAYVLDRLKREGRGGEILKVSENVFLYSGKYFDTNEMLGWVRTFTGRILDVQGSNTYVMNKFNRDFYKMYQMYHLESCTREGNDGII